MPWSLKRYQHSKQIHFLTFSCFRRLPYFADECVRDVFPAALERTRRVYRFLVYGYVVMPEHVHLLVSEPERETLATAVQALKVSVVRRLGKSRRPHICQNQADMAHLPGTRPDGAFWQTRYYDHNVRSYDSFVVKLRYAHRNPVKRGLVTRPEDWKWSSFRHYATGEVGVVEVESQWTADRREGRIPNVFKVFES